MASLRAHSILKHFALLAFALLPLSQAFADPVVLFTRGGQRVPEYSKKIEELKSYFAIAHASPPMITLDMGSDLGAKRFQNITGFLGEGGTTAVFSLARDAGSHHAIRIPRNGEIPTEYIDFFLDGYSRLVKHHEISIAKTYGKLSQRGRFAVVEEVDLAGRLWPTLEYIRLGDAYERATEVRKMLAQIYPKLNESARLEAIRGEIIKFIGSLWRYRELGDLREDQIVIRRDGSLTLLDWLDIPSSTFFTSKKEFARHRFVEVPINGVENFEATRGHYIDQVLDQALTLSKWEPTLATDARAERDRIRHANRLKLRVSCVELLVTPLFFFLK